jgi:hypothetical protein
VKYIAMFCDVFSSQQTTDYAADLCKVNPAIWVNVLGLLSKLSDLASGQSIKATTMEAIDLCTPLDAAAGSPDTLGDLCVRSPNRRRTART